MEDQVSIERMSQSLLFLKTNFVGADPEKIKMVTSVFRRTIA